ncbi:hypothetical protein PFISCL1PPCAC_13257 [Pristionchus fissidentatus]|uniref:MADF domain-containing protein n=1 Tax=Pristionchus fissidentatus TaxID=1538716 RepID=A0AAV5VV76_9BILA|nr:hypothetical protein PFISCL1PPCAC_13257 [Pristionchus fissidentatus]
MTGKRKTAHENFDEEDGITAESKLISKRQEIPHDIISNFIADIEKIPALWKKSSKLYKMTSIKSAHLSGLDKKHGFERGLSTKLLGYLKQQFSLSILPSGSGCPSPIKTRKEFPFKDELWFLKDGCLQENHRISSSSSSASRVDFGDSSEDRSSDEEDASDDSDAVLGRSDNAETTIDDTRETKPPIARELSEGTKNTLAEIGKVNHSSDGQSFVKTSKVNNKKKKHSFAAEMEKTNSQIDQLTKIIEIKNSLVVSEPVKSPNCDVHSMLDRCIGKVHPDNIDDFKVELLMSMNNLAKKYSSPQVDAVAQPAQAHHSTVPQCYQVPYGYPPPYLSQSHGYHVPYPAQPHSYQPPAFQPPNSITPPTSTPSPDTPSSPMPFQYLP